MDGGQDNESLLVKLTRMEGKLDLSNLRHQQMDDWKVTVDQRLHRHGNELMKVSDLPPRVNKLEEDARLQTGERLGISKTIKVAWLTGGSGLTAVLMAVLRKAGVL